MRYFPLVLEALSPLAIRADHAAVGSGSFGYLSGTALAGSLAHAHRLFHPDDRPGEFERLFLSGQVQYPDLYPADFKSETISQDKYAPVYPLPRTAQSCKRFPGFLPVGDEDEDAPPHGVRDTLLDWTLFTLARDSQPKAGKPPLSDKTLIALLDAHKECGCKKPMTRLRGYYRSKDGKGSRATSPTRLQTHTGINRETGTAQEGILYHRRVFEEHSHFWGLVKTTDALAQPFTDFIVEVRESGLVRVGTGRTRGMGKVKLSIPGLETAPRVEEGDEESARRDQFIQRLRRFSSYVSDLVQAVLPPDVYDFPRTRFYFALTLHSPLILRDALLRYRGTIDSAALVELLGIKDTFTRLYETAAVCRVSGWNELWGTPRTNEYAIETGSVFLFAIDTEPAGPLLEALFRLEEEGAGQRRAEGFGRVCVSDPFHLEVTAR